MKPLNTSPTITFRNLSEEKQCRIMKAAVHEFADYGFQQASVNRIVKELGIAKGSLYQYFSGKEALFLHVFADFIELVKQTVKENTAMAEKQLFSQIRYVLDAGLKFIKTYPQYFRLYTRLLSEEDIPQRTELLAKVRFFPIEYFEPLIKKGQDNGTIRADVSTDLIIFMIDAVLDKFFMSTSSTQAGSVIYTIEPSGSEIDQIIRLLEGGLSVKST